MSTTTSTLNVMPLDDELERLRHVTRPLRPRLERRHVVEEMIDRARRWIVARWRDRGQRGGVTSIADDLVHCGVAVTLTGVAIYVLIHTVVALAVATSPFAQAATASVNGLLFAIIIMEVMRTVTTRFDQKSLHLRPFLVIGTVSATREMLAVGARLSLQESSEHPSVVHLKLLELGVNGAVVLALATALVLVHRFGGMSEDGASETTIKAEA